MNMTYYIAKGNEVLKNRPTPLVLLCLLSFMLKFGVSGGNSFLLQMFAVILVYPLIYGRYVEILQGNASITYSEIMKKHWLNFFLVMLVAGTFYILTALIGASFARSSLALHFSISALYEVALIYIIPLVFLTKTNIACIASGVRYLIDNFRFSVPLILLTLLPVFVEWVLTATGFSKGEAFFTRLAGAIFVILYTVIQFIVFIAATLALRDGLGVVNQEVH